MASGKGLVARQLVQNLRGDLNLLSTEARKKHPAVREAAERGAMKLKSLSEAKGFSLQVLSETDDVVHPLLFACESRNPQIVLISLSSLQRLIQFKAIPKKSVEPIVATLKGLMDAGIEELKILQTILLLITATDVVQGKALAKILVLCFKLYASRDPTIHNTAGAAIRQIVSSMFERMNVVMRAAETGGKREEDARHKELPTQARDAYLLFQDICFLTNGDPPAWLNTSLEMELSLGLELLEAVLRGYSHIFIEDKLFNQLLTERVCPLVIKLFSPTSKYRHTSTSSSTAMATTDKPTFALSIRLLRILGVLIKEFYSCLITQCEIFLSMLVKFLDSDKPLWQRTLAVEVLHSFCNQPLLLRSFCESYDMQEHSSKIFCDIVDALGGFIQSNFTIASPVVQLPFGITSSPNVTNNSNTGHMTPTLPGVKRHMHLFIIRNTNLQVEALPSSSHNKPVYLEMLDKTEVPGITEGYPLVVAMNALLDAIKSVSLVVNDNITQTTPTQPPDVVLQSLHNPVASGDVKEIMLKSSWSGVLAALALLLDACADEHTTRMILDAHHTFIHLCGKLKMTTSRDAFLTSLCKACLPPKYAMSFITQRGGSKATIPPSPRHEGRRTPEPDTRPQGDGQKRPTELGPKRKPPEGGGGGSEGGGKGTPILHRSGGGQQAREQQSGLVTVKNLQCISTLLQTVDNHGNILDTAWLLVLTTVQHIVEVFGLKPVEMGSLQPTRVTENSSLVLVSIDKKSEILEITDKLTNLFKSTQQLSDDSVLHLIKALCQLSSIRETNLFPISSLLETGISNLTRVRLVWEPITKHLIQVCSHGDQSVRQFGADALSSLVRSALKQEYQEDIQSMLLSPLRKLTSVKHTDVRQKQLECVSHVLHSSGQSLQSSWSVILDVINSATSLQSEALVRAGFQSLQLVIADFLPVIPPLCLPTCVEVVGQYGLQTVDINVSLTSIGLLWNIADYLYQNRATLHDSLEALKSETSQTSYTSSLETSFIKSVRNSSLPVFNSVWMLLFKHLSVLCVDLERGSVRKSASQTLFSTISAHGGVLEKETWQGVLWQVLFPLLERVNQATGQASTSSFQTPLLIHHTRDTAQKQWAETQVLTLSGTARLFQTRWSILCGLEGFERAWTTFLEAIKACAASSSSEVSIAAMKSFLSVVDPHRLAQSPHSSSTNLFSEPVTHQEAATGTSSLDVPGGLSPEQGLVIWTKAWQTLHGIGIECVCNKLPTPGILKSILKLEHKQPKLVEVDAFFATFPSQGFLVQLLKIFPLVFSRLKPNFSKKDFHGITRVFEAALLMPIAKDVSPFLVPSSNENLMSAVHRLVLKCLGVIFTEEEVFIGEQRGRSNEASLILEKKSEIRDMRSEMEIETSPEFIALCPDIIQELLKYTSYAFDPPELVKLTQDVSSAKSHVMVLNYVPFGLAALSLAVQLYRACLVAGVQSMEPIPERFLKTLHTPLRLKHRCSHPSVWTKSLEALLLVLEPSLPSMLKQGEAKLSFWRELASVLEHFLFTPIPEGMEMSAEKMREYEAMDMKVIEMIKREILPSSTAAPQEFLHRLTTILNQGSIHSATDQFDGAGPAPRVPFRENFARVCFEALLQFSFIHSQGSNIDSTSQLALNALLERCEEVLVKFVSDERLSGTCPLPRARMNEVALVLKSVTVLISTLKEAQKNSSAQVDHAIWQHVGRLYPALVQCVTCSSSEVRTALKEALAQFSDLINP